MWFFFFYTGNDACFLLEDFQHTNLVEVVVPGEVKGVCGSWLTEASCGLHFLLLLVQHHLHDRHTDAVGGEAPTTGCWPRSSYPSVPAGRQSWWCSRCPDSSGGPWGPSDCQRELWCQQDRPHQSHPSRNPTEGRKNKNKQKRIECVFGVFSHICLLISRIKKRIKCHIYLHLWSTLSSGLYCGSTSDMSSRSLMRASWTSSLGTMRSTWCLQKENHCGLQVFAQLKTRREERSWPTQVDGRFLQTNWCQNNSYPTKLTLQAKTWDMRHQLPQISS